MGVTPPVRRTRIKICGLSSVEEVEHAVALGVDAVGLVFHPSSPRAISAVQAGALTRRLPPFVSAVALFVNPQASMIEEVQRAAQIHCLQFHGDEQPARCAELAALARLPWIKAFGVGAAHTGADLLELLSRYSAANGWVLDALVEGYGGGGKVFDWSIVPAELGRRVVLSGGLNAQNVGDAIRRIRPYAVDVSSGVEVTGRRGVKDLRRMSEFVAAVRAADALLQA